MMRLRGAPSGKPQFIPWAAAYEPFGQGFARVREFRRRLLQTLSHVLSACSPARLADDEGLILAATIVPQT
jgi:hypothetical protein